MRSHTDMQHQWPSTVSPSQPKAANLGKNPYMKSSFVSACKDRLADCGAEAQEHGQRQISDLTAEHEPIAQRTLNRKPKILKGSNVFCLQLSLRKKSQLDNDLRP